ncbi:MAG: CSS-motif domain-containing protein, partial [Plesiomonas shigelloides]
MLNRLSHKLTLCIAIILIPFSLLLWLMYSDYIRQINHDAEYTAQKTTEAVNGLLSYAEQANQTILAKPHDLSQCDNIVLALRKQVATVPYVRSVNLAQHGAIYCSSLYGTVHVQDEYTRYHNGKLLLLPGTLVKSNYPLIVVRNTKGNIAVLSSIGSIYFQSILQQQESPELL